MSEGGPILVFDSGVGGLSVLRAIRAALPDVRIVYVADDAAFPYGAWEEQALSDHIVALMGRAYRRARAGGDRHRLQHRFDAGAAAASRALFRALRRHRAGDQAGGGADARRGVVAVLATPGTMKRDYTRALIKSFGQACHVRLVGAPALARLAEARMRGEPFDRDEIAEQIAPCFEEMEGRRTDIVVLACTHYPFLADVMAELAPWPVTWLDPAPAIARRLVAVLGGRMPGAGGESVAIFTSGRAPSSRSLAASRAWACRPTPRRTWATAI